MPTTNPVPSQDPSDLLFNAGKLDEVLNGTGTSFTDRLGVARRTVSGMNADFDDQLADAESDLNVYRADAAASAAQALGYLNTIRTTSYGAYASDPATDPLGNPPNVGDEYFNTTSNLLKRFNGTTWQASDINTANLAAPSGSSLVGHGGGTVQDVLDAVTGPNGAASVGYTPDGVGAVATDVQEVLRETVRASGFGVDASAADNLTQLQKAVTHACTLVNAELVLPAGTIDFSASRYVSASDQDGIIVDVPDGGTLVIRGAGPGATKLRRKASATFNDFASLFVIKNNQNATVLFKDLELDGNAENITPSLPVIFTYEHTGLVRIQAGTGTMRMLGASNVWMSNPTADGFYFSAQVGACLFDNIHQVNRARTRSDIQMTYIPNRVMISNCNLKDFQTEPAAVNCEAFVINNLVTDHIDIVGNNIATDTFNVFLTNVKATEPDPARNSTLRVIKNGHFNSCEFVGISRLRDVNATFTNCLITQRISAGAVIGIQLDYATDYPTVLRFYASRFEASSAGTGAMIQPFTVVPSTRTHLPELHIKNCTSDKNAQYFLDLNRAGIAYVENSHVKGTTACFIVSNSTGNVSKLYLKNNTYDSPNVIALGGNVDSIVSIEDLIDGDLISPCSRVNSSGSTLTFKSNRKILVNASPESSISGITGDVASLKATGTNGWREWTFIGSSGLNTGWRLSRQRFHKDSTANRPPLGVADVGYQYFDTTLDADGKPIWWTGSSWVDGTGATV